MKYAVAVLHYLCVIPTASSFFIYNGGNHLMQSQMPGIARHKALINVRGGSDSPPPPPDVSVNDEPLEDTSSDTVVSEGSPIEVQDAAPIESNESPPEPIPEPIQETVTEITPFQKSLPNLLTYARCLSIPLLILTFYLPKMALSTPLLSCLSKNSNIACSLLFALASFTDWLDGYLARKWNVTSSFGAFLDPVADKLMVSTVLILLSGQYGIQVALPTSIILGREISVSALREWMASKQLRDVVKVGPWGKVKTACTMVALTMLLWDFNKVALALLYACTVLTITSAWVYFDAAAPILMKN